MTYAQLMNRALELLDEEKPEEAYEFMKEEGPKAEYANPAQVYNFTYCVAAICGKTEEAMGLLKEAVYTKGYWYDYEYLMEDEDLEPLRQMSEFATVANLCRERQEAAVAAAKPVLEEDGLEAGKPFLMVLHGDQQNAKLTAPYWQAAKEAGCGLCFAQSSQIQVSDGYLWDDEEIAAAEIKSHWAAMEAKGMKDGILCGFSSGGRAAFYAAVSGAIAPKGLILMAPWLPELDEWTEDLSKLKEAGTAVYLCCGDADEDCFEDTETLFEILDDQGIDVDFNLVPDLDHDYPENFDKILKDALSFVRG